MNNLKRRLLLAVGWLIIVVGAILGVIPGPGGIPIVAVGAMIVLSQSRAARKQFIRLQKRFPKVMGSIRRVLKRKRKSNDNQSK
ncbi:MAG: hypothetical protein E2O92_01690 [Alphaproteobacteria bacterium]|nr:MAG: hypothetical protein E2O92_01690 [Alphaproteobacteria bacterium]